MDLAHDLTIAFSVSLLARGAAQRNIPALHSLPPRTSDAISDDARPKSRLSEDRPAGRRRPYFFTMNAFVAG
jgi:hypothetical protein